MTTLSIKSAKGLLQLDGAFTGKSDPFVKVFQQGEQIYRTKTVDDKLNPVWAEGSETVKIQSDTAIYLEVWEDDTVSGNDFMGCVTVEPKEFSSGVDHTCKLTRREVEETEVVLQADSLGTLVVEFVDAPSEDTERETPVDSSVKQNDRNDAVEGSTKEDDEALGQITIVRASNLLQRDGAFTGKSDPFVKVFQQGEQIHRTKTVDDKLNPVWAEGTETVKIQSDTAIYLEVWEDDTVSGNDFMGCATLLPSELISGTKEIRLVCRDDEETEVVLQADTLGVLVVDLAIPDSGSQHDAEQKEAEQEDKQMNHLMDGLRNIEEGGQGQQHEGATTSDEEPPAASGDAHVGGDDSRATSPPQSTANAGTTDAMTTIRYVDTAEGSTQMLSLVDEAKGLLAQGNRGEQEALLDKEGRVFLREALRVCGDEQPVLQTVVLNALGFCEKRVGNLRPALAALLQAAEIEGGLESASAKTLLNLSATYCGLLMFAEAAAIANAAVLRCRTDFQAGGPVLKATAHHNLAAALEGLGELGHAQESYQVALRLIASMRGSATYRTIERASEQLQLKLENVHATNAQQDWAREVMPGVASRSHKTLRRNGQLPPLKSGAGGSSTSVNTSTKRIADRPHDPTGGAKEPNDPRTKSPWLNNMSPVPGGSPSPSAYSQSLKKNIVMKPIVLPVSLMHSALHSADNSPSPQNKRLNQSAPASLTVSGNNNDSSVQRSKGLGRAPANRRLKLANQQADSVHKRRKSAIALQDQIQDLSGANPDRIQWNTDPTVHSDTPHRIGLLPRNPDLERHVGDRYISRFFIPLAEDLRYKENTRRHAIKTEWKAKFERIKANRRLHFVSAVEDEERANTEIEELRVRRVLLHWVKGKLLFAECSYRCEAEESQGRDVILADFFNMTLSLEPQSKRLNTEANAEDRKYRLLIQEATARNELEIYRETHTAADTSTVAVRKAKKSLSYALGLWCMESVMDPQHANQLADPSMSNSLHFLERYVVFGVPRKGGGTGTSALAPTSTPSNPNIGAHKRQTPRRASKMNM